MRRRAVRFGPEYTVRRGTAADMLACNPAKISRLLDAGLLEADPDDDRYITLNSLFTYRAGQRAASPAACTVTGEEDAAALNAATDLFDTDD